MFQYSLYIYMLYISLAVFGFDIHVDSKFVLFLAGTVDAALMRRIG